MTQCHTTTVSLLHHVIGGSHGVQTDTVLSVNQVSDRPYVIQEAQLSQRDRARFVSLNILLTHSRSFEMTLLSRACVSPYYYFIETMSVCRTVYEIFSVKEWRDLETAVRVVQDHWKWRRSIDHYTTFYWSAIVV